jgi:hypothetical protein
MHEAVASLKAYRCQKFDEATIVAGGRGAARAGKIDPIG